MEFIIIILFPAPASANVNYNFISNYNFAATQLRTVIKQVKISLHYFYIGVINYDY